MGTLRLLVHPAARVWTRVDGPTLRQRRAHRLIRHGWLGHWQQQLVQALAANPRFLRGAGHSSCCSRLLLGGVLFASALAGHSVAGNPPLFLFMVMLLSINIIWPLFNLLPIWPLDGGMISREIFTGLSPSRGLLASLWISLIVAALISLNALLSHFQNQGFIPRIPSGGVFAGIMFALFAVDNFRAIQELSNRGRYSKLTSILPSGIGREIRSQESGVRSQEVRGAQESESEVEPPTASPEAIPPGSLSWLTPDS